MNLRNSQYMLLILFLSVINVQAFGKDLNPGCESCKGSHSKNVQGAPDLTPFKQLTVIGKVFAASKAVLPSEDLCHISKIEESAMTIDECTYKILKSCMKQYGLIHNGAVIKYLAHRDNLTDIMTFSIETPSSRYKAIGQFGSEEVIDKQGKKQGFKCHAEDTLDVYLWDSVTGKRVFREHTESPHTLGDYE